MKPLKAFGPQHTSEEIARLLSEGLKNGRIAFKNEVRTQMTTVTTMTERTTAAAEGRMVAVRPEGRPAVDT